MRAPWMILTVRRRASGVRGLVIGTSRVGMPYYYRSRPPAQVMTRPFLIAHWSNVVLLTFEAPEELVRAQVAPGVEPDRWNGKTHVSLVALEMRDARLAHPRLRGPPTGELPGLRQARSPPRRDVRARARPQPHHRGGRATPLRGAVPGRADLSPRRRGHRQRKRGIPLRARRAVPSPRRHRVARQRRSGRVNVRALPQRAHVRRSH